MSLGTLITDGGDHVIDVPQLDHSPAVVHLTPTTDADEFFLPTAISLGHSPLVILVNASETYALRVKIQDGGRFFPDAGHVDVPAGTGTMVLASQRGLEGKDWTVISPAVAGDLTVPGELLVDEPGGLGPFSIVRMKGGGRVELCWNTLGGNAPSYESSGETAMRLRMHHGELTFDVAPGQGKTAGDPIEWDPLLKLNGARALIHDVDVTAKLAELEGRIAQLEA